MWKFIVICSLLLTFTGSVVTADQHTEKSVEINQKVKEWQLKDTEARIAPSRNSVKTRRLSFSYSLQRNARW